MHFVVEERFGYSFVAVVDRTVVNYCSLGCNRCSLDFDIRLGSGILLDSHTVDFVVEADQKTPTHQVVVAADNFGLVEVYCTLAAAIVEVVAEACCS